MSGSLLLCKDVANSKLRELEVDSSGLLKVDKVDVSALATESSLTALSSKVMSYPVLLYLLGVLHRLTSHSKSPNSRTVLGH